MKTINTYIYNIKHIKNYINERLHITTKSHTYSCKPKTKNELQEIIIQRIKEDGNECDLNDIDVSKIEDMSFLFNARENDIFKKFNGDIGQWDVSNVETMEWMFYRCEQFNCDLSRWDVSNVKNMERMFGWCKKFNQDLNKWNVSNVETMFHAFIGCPAKPKWYEWNK